MQQIASKKLWSSGSNVTISKMLNKVLKAENIFISVYKYVLNTIANRNNI